MSTTQLSPQSFQASRTCRSLVSACREEALARRQYLDAAERCESAGLQVVAHAFRFTAAQEKEHAAIFHGLLRTFGGQPATPSRADIPPLPDAPQLLLQAVIQMESSRAEHRFPAFACTAQEEGYPRIATAFQRIADTEHLHARRFRQYAEALSGGTLFSSAARSGWLCLPCGHLHYGREAPECCDACGRPRGHFIRSDFHPFAVTP